MEKKEAKPIKHIPCNMLRLFACLIILNKTCHTSMIRQKIKKTSTIQVCIILTAIKLIRFAFHTINSLLPAVGMPPLQLYNFK